MKTESYILGTILSDGSQMVSVTDILTPDMFSEDAHRDLYATMQKMFDERKDIDLITVSERLKGSQAVEMAGGPMWLATLGSHFTPGNLREYAVLLKERYVQRKALEAASRVHEAVRDSLGLDEVVAAINRGADVVNGLLVESNKARAASEVVISSLELLDKRMNTVQRGEMNGIPTGLTKLNRLTNGWRGNQLIILAARPGQGKTQLAITFSLEAARKGFHSMIFSLEMSAASLMDRMIINVSGVDSEAYRSGRLSPDQWQTVTGAGSKIQHLGITIDDTPQQTIRNISTKCMIQKRRGSLDLVIIDYLQLIESEDRKIIREQQVANMTRSLKLLSKELSIPVILLCQLNREAETNSGKRPSLANLRESGAIEQDADLVMLLYRPATYKIESIDIGNQTINTRNVGFLEVAKQRDGAVGTVVFSHDENFSRIKDYQNMRE
jgi:replicative DNA helicase